MRSHPLLLLVLALLVLITSLPVRADGTDSFCQLRNVTVERLANGLCIRLIADGLINLSGNRSEMRWTQQKSFTFFMDNIRGGTTPMYEIGQNPISHLEFALPTGAKDGVGLLCTLVLYRVGQVTIFDGELGWDDTRWAPTDIPQIMITKTRQQNEIVIQIINDQPRTVYQNRTIQSTPQLTIQGMTESLSLHVVNTPIRQVINAISPYAAIPILIGDEVQCSITTHLTDLPWYRIISIIGRCYGLSVEVRDAVCYVGNGLATSATGYWNAETRIIPLHYLQPDNVKQLLPDFLLSALRPDTNGNALIVSGSPVLLDKIERDVKVLDQPTYQCRLRAWIISTSSQNKELAKLFLHYSEDKVNAAINSTGQVNIQLSAYQPQELLAAIHELESNEHIQISAIPFIQVANGKYADLFLGNRAFYWATDPYSQNTVLSPLEAGTKLEVFPLISQECITTWIGLDNSIIQSSNALGPLVTQQRMDTTIRIQSGDTIIIGGLRLATDELRTDMSVVPKIKGKDKDMMQQDVWVILQAESALQVANVISEIPKVPK